MTENVKKFLELISQDEKLKKAFCEAPDAKSIISLAAEHGITLTDEELKMSASKKQELDEGELASVAGGKACYCAVAGGGLKTHEMELPCGCVLGGVGDLYTRRKEHAGRCVCYVGGAGSEETYWRG